MNWLLGAWMHTFGSGKIETLYAKVVQGKKLRWRVHVLDQSGRTVMLSNVRGFATREEAVKAARRIAAAKIIA